MLKLFAPLKRLTGFRRSGGNPRKINLALQGGGALGAFTWGVLDRLLEEDRLVFDTVSGASAGAMNAAALASGLTIGGRDGAKETLAALWARIARAGAGVPALNAAAVPWAPNGVLEALSFWFPPDPLRGIVTDLFHFEAVRAQSPVQLIISATDLATEEARYFTTSELTPEVLMASSCLPMVHQPVRIGHRAYWDGGYSANPPVVKVIEHSKADETLLVRLLPVGVPGQPSGAREILGLVNQMSFNRPLAAELERIREYKSLVEGLRHKPPEWLARIGHHKLTQIDGAAHIGPDAAAKALYPRNALITDLRTKGRAAAEAWLAQSPEPAVV